MDQPCGWRISPFGAKLEIAGKKSFLWSYPCFQAHHLETYADTAKAKFVDFLAPLSCHSLSRELSDPADCQSPCRSCHTGTRQHTLIWIIRKCLIVKQNLWTNLVREGSDVLSLVEVERSCRSLEGGIKVEMWASTRDCDWSNLEESAFFLGVIGIKDRGPWRGLVEVEGKAGGVLS